VKEFFRYLPRARCFFLLLALVAGCSRGVSQHAWHDELAVDFIASFDKASVDDGDFPAKYRELTACPKVYKDPWSGGSPRLIKAGFEMDSRKMFQSVKRCLYMGARRNHPCRVSIPFRLEKKGEYIMTFELGGHGLSPTADLGMRIVLNGGERRIVVFNSRGRAMASLNGLWCEYEVNLPADDYAEALLEIVFASGSRPAGHLFLANPRIFRRCAGPVERPAVVFIVVDSLRADAVDAVERRYNVTPHIDSVARDGITCTNHFIVSNWTRPSTVAMLASAYASTTGLNLFYPPVQEDEKDYFYRKSGIRPVTTLLKDRGYLTRSVGNNAFIIDYTGIGVDLDFDDLSEYQTQWEDTADITAETVAWLEKNRGRSFFLFINYNAPHNAYIPPREFLSPLQKRLPHLHPWFRAYLGEVAYADHHIGILLETLKRLGIYDSTILVITSDHGEIFSPEHEVSPYTGVKSIHTHGQTQLDEELRVPLVIKPQKDRAAGPAVIKEQLRNIDIAPTILDLMGMPAPGAYEGRSIIPVLKGEEREERLVYSEGRMMYSVRAGGYKYAERFYGFGLRPWHWGGDVVEEYSELFDLRTDPGETKNLVYLKPEIAGRMRARLKEARFQQPENTLTARGAPAAGTMRVIEGFFYEVSAPRGQVAPRRVNRRQYAFNLQPGESIKYQTIPADAPVQLSLRKDIRVLAGRYLLPVAERVKDHVWVVRPADSATHGKPADEVIELADESVCYWHDPGRHGVRGAKKEARLSRDVNDLLRKWGYIQGGEKVEGR
jgi:arylsulfatase A-like enzyme